MKSLGILYTLAFFAVVALGVAPAALAFDCVNDGNNLLAGSNCGLNSNLSGWTIIDSATHIPGDGDPVAGCGEATCADCTNTGLTTPCITVLPSTEYNYGFRFKDVSDTASLGCGCAVNQYSTADCSGTPDSSSMTGGAPGSTSWAPMNATGTTLGDTQSVTMSCGCNSSPATAAHQVRIDNAYFGIGSTIFADGFEDGTTGEWSNTVP